MYRGPGRSDHKVGARWVGRREQVELLQELICKHTKTVPGLLVFGASNTGKTAVVRDVLTSSDAVFSYSDCHYLCGLGPKHLFESIATQLARHNEKMFWELRNYVKKGQVEPVSEFEAQRNKQLRVNQKAFETLILNPLKNLTEAPSHTNPSFSISLASVPEESSLTHAHNDLLPDQGRFLAPPTHDNHLSQDSPGSPSSAFSLTPVRQNLLKDAVYKLDQPKGEDDLLYTDKPLNWGSSLNQLMIQILAMTWIESYPMYIVLDKAEYLVEHHPELLSAFFLLADASARHICPILITEAALSFPEFASTLIPVHFPMYEASDLVSIISGMLEKTTEAQIGGPENLSLYVEYVVSALEHATRDLGELMRNIKLLLPHYSEIISTLQQQAAIPIPLPPDSSVSSTNHTSSSSAMTHTTTIPISSSSSSSSSDSDSSSSSLPLLLTSVDNTPTSVSSSPHVSSPISASTTMSNGDVSVTFPPASLLASRLSQLRPHCQRLMREERDFNRRPKKSRTTKTLTAEVDTAVARYLALYDSVCVFNGDVDATCIWIVMGAFLATHTPPQQDRRMFTSRATKKLNQRNAKKFEMVSVAKYVSLERVIAITETIMDPLLLPVLRINNLSYVDQLCALRYLDKSDQFHDLLRIRCLVDFDGATLLAESISFDLTAYLAG